MSSEPRPSRSELSEVGRLRAENDRLGKEISALQAQPRTASVDQSQAVADSLQRLRKDLVGQVPPVSKNGQRLTKGFIELFGLSGGEQQAMQAALDKARARLAELTRANTKVSLQPDGSAVIEVRPFPADGGKAYDELMTSFSQILGTERNAEFTALGGPTEMENAFHDFGTGQATITASWTPSTKAETYDYRLRLVSNSGQGQSFSGNITSGGTSSPSLPSTLFDRLADMEAAPLGLNADLLPTDFGPKK